MKKRLKKLREALVAQKLEGIILRVNEGDNPNVRYMSGFGGSTACLVITGQQAFIVTDARYYARALKEAPDFKLIKVERGKKYSAYVNQALTACGISKKDKIGFEAATTPFEVARLWGDDLRAKLVATLHVVERFRQVKDKDEIKQLRKACRITSKAFEEVVPLIEPGMTESEVAFEIDMCLRKLGAVSNSFTTIAAGGANSAIPHHNTGDYKLKPGDPLVLDFGGLFAGGYCSDITRTVFVPGKKPDKEMVELYRVVLAANKAARKALKAGVTYRQYDKVARDYIIASGYGDFFTHGLGHSLGLVAHDPYDYEHDPFQEGVVVTDEPGIYIEGLGGVRIEDDLLVTKDGAERLTTAPYLKL